MQIASNSVVTISYSLFDAQGELIEKSPSPVTYLHGGYDNIFPLVEQALQGKTEGDSISVKLEPADAFGDYDEELLRVEPRAQFPDTLEVGMQFEGIPGEDPEADAEIFTVTDIADDKVVLDSLVFECQVLEVREASEEEAEHGHVHGPEGHQH
jgi:FKBP-type peptidyl-prolyl cis-trans isomerase SlyD